MLAVSGEHAVQFYEGEPELIETVAAYVDDALREGGVSVVIATEEHHREIESRLGAIGVDAVQAANDGTLISLDAAATLRLFMPDGRIDRDAFMALIGGIIRQATATEKPVYAFGEMVALLWEAGDVPATLELERLWNKLAEQFEFSLLCGYRRTSFVGEEHAETLARVCREHSAVL